MVHTSAQYLRRERCYPDFASAVAAIEYDIFVLHESRYLDRHKAISVQGFATYG